MSLSLFLPSTTREEKVFSIKFSKMKNESQLNLSTVHRIFRVLSPHICRHGGGGYICPLDKFWKGKRRSFHKHVDPSSKPKKMNESINKYMCIMCRS